MEKFLLLFLCCFFSCKDKIIKEPLRTDTEKNVSPFVSVKSLELIDAPIPIEVSGMLELKETLNLSFKTGGVIERIYVDETERVTKGQLLASIRTTEIDAMVMKAQKAADKARRDLIRIEKMYADTVATMEQVENLKTVSDIADADLKIAKLNQEYAKMIAPISGRIQKRFFENNEFVAPGLPVIALASDGKNSFGLKANVADKDVVRVRLNDKANVFFDAYPRQSFDAYVSEISEGANPRTGTFTVELSITPPDRLVLKSGFIGTATLMPGSQASYYRIEIDALTEADKKSATIFVLRQEDGKNIVRKMNVFPEYIGNDFFTVSGIQLEEGLQVVIQGAAYLQDGMEVRLIK